jgi:aminoacrylate hydrolase
MIATELAFEDRVVGGIFTRRCGVRGAETVLFSGGLGGSGMHWAPQVAALATTYDVVLYDHRGTGRSDRAPLGTLYAVRDMADDMRIVLEGLDVAKAHIVGHAAGGVAALELARIVPRDVLSATVVNGWAVADPHFLRCFEIRKAIYRSEGAAGYLRAQPLFLYPASWISAHLAELDAEAEHVVANFQDEATLFARIGALGAFDIRASLATMTTPVLVVCAEDDMLVPAHASHALAAALPNATLVALPWGGHSVNVTAPEAFDRALLAFLASLRR